MIPREGIGIGQMENFLLLWIGGLRGASSRYNLNQCPDCKEGIFWVRDATWLV